MRVSRGQQHTTTEDDQQEKGNLKNPRNWFRFKYIQSKSNKRNVKGNNRSGRTADTRTDTVSYTDDFSIPSIGSHQSSDSRKDVSSALIPSIIEPIFDEAEKDTPQDYFDQKLKERGYSIERYETLQTGYYNQATNAQQISYHKYVKDLVKDRQLDKLRTLFATGIVSTNPANAFGESLIHYICRLGFADALNIMISIGCDVQVSDDFGRTPMHDACWGSQPAFDVVELLLEIDPRLMFMMDERGLLPLSGIPKKDFKAWISFLSYILDSYWPPRRSNEGPPPLSTQRPNSRPIQDPDSDLSSMYVKLLASGRMTPEEVFLMQTSCDEEETDEMYNSTFQGMQSCGTFDFSKSSFQSSIASFDTYSNDNRFTDEIVDGAVDITDEQSLALSVLLRHEQSHTKVDENVLIGMQLGNKLTNSKRNFNLSWNESMSNKSSNILLNTVTSKELHHYSVAQVLKIPECCSPGRSAKSTLHEKYTNTPAMSVMSFKSAQFFVCGTNNSRPTQVNCFPMMSSFEMSDNNFDCRDETEPGLSPQSTTNMKLLPQTMIPIRGCTTPCPLRTLLSPNALPSTTTPKRCLQLPPMTPKRGYVRQSPLQKIASMQQHSAKRATSTTHNLQSIAHHTFAPNSINYCTADDDGLLAGSC